MWPFKLDDGSRGMIFNLVQLTCTVVRKMIPLFLWVSDPANVHPRPGTDTRAAGIIGAAKHFAP
jgi:hypothetical protein